jgi:hypothetical protein
VCAAEPGALACALRSTIPGSQEACKKEDLGDMVTDEPSDGRSDRRSDRRTYGRWWQRR